MTRPQELRFRKDQISQNAPFKKRIAFSTVFTEFTSLRNSVSFIRYLECTTFLLSSPNVVHWLVTLFVIWPKKICMPGSCPLQD